MVVTDGLAPEDLRRRNVKLAPSVEQAMADGLAEYGPAALVAGDFQGPSQLPPGFDPFWKPRGLEPI
jgi:hypothetical protein